MATEDELAAVHQELQAIDGSLSRIEEGIQSSLDEVACAIRAPEVELGPITVISLVAGVIASNGDPARLTPEGCVKAAELIVGAVYERTGKNQRERERFEKMIKDAGLSQQTPAEGPDDEG